MDKLFFDAHRLGRTELRSNMADAEPVMRNGDSLSVDMSAVRRSDAPAPAVQAPTVSTAKTCQLMRYAGVSEQQSRPWISMNGPHGRSRGLLRPSWPPNDLVLLGRFP